MNLTKFLVGAIYIVLFLVSIAFWDGIVYLAANRLWDWDVAHEKAYAWGGLILCAGGGGFIGWLLGRSFVKTIYGLDIHNAES